MIDEDSAHAEIRTAAGISARDLRDTQLFEFAVAGWFGALAVQMTRHTGPLQALLDIASNIREGRDEAALLPHPTHRFKQVISQIGRAFTDDSERITQDAVAGTIISILWGQLSHYAYNIGLTPNKLDYGPTVNGQSFTRVLWAARGAQFHGMAWLLRDFKINAEGKEQIEILRAAGIEAIPFSAYSALRFFIPDGVVTSATLRILEIGQLMMNDALAAGQPKKVGRPKRVTRKKSAIKKPIRKKLPK